MIEEFINGYFQGIFNSLNEIELEKVKKVSEILYDAYQKRRYVFIMGNGGSASTASHFACDLGKTTICDGKQRFRVISLNDNIPLMTALSNDFGYEKVFIEQLMNLVNPGDIVICITGSGNSPNVIQAVNYAKECGAITIGLLGFGGGQIKEILHEHITISNQNYGQVEDVHLILCHAITQYFKERIEKE
ncbi:MAG: SIS domain-containing protein [candidate division WOR-3 bacterium]